MLITEKAGLNSADFNLNDNSGTSLNSIVYLPSKRVTFNSGTNVDSHQLKLVADTFIFNQVTLDLENITSSETTNSSDGVSEFVRLTK